MVLNVFLISPHRIQGFARTNLSHKVSIKPDFKHPVGIPIDKPWLW